jgi:hypothetical protein
MGMPGQSSITPPASCWQAVQPSPATVFASSQASGSSASPLPQNAVSTATSSVKLPLVPP